LLLVLIAFFLFFQSALEAIVNNWATTYLINRGLAKEDALFALSLHIAGMVVARLLTGSVFRRVPQVGIMWSCLVLLALGIFLMQIGSTFPVTGAGLILSGAGLSGGFPVMLGFVGERFANLSGTAFSFVFVVALVGNMLINYLMGVIVHEYGVEHLTTVSYIQIGAMAALFLFIVQKLRSNIA
jgi:cyanate permease